MNNIDIYVKGQNPTSQSSSIMKSIRINLNKNNSSGTVSELPRKC